jgi:proline iminopeptidase
VSSEPPDLVPMSDGCALWTEAAGTGPPVALCHGGPGLWDYLAPLARLAGPGYRVHRYDQRGSGRSGRRRPWTLGRFGRDLDELRARFGYERWVVGGHSFGADLALRYALEYPHRVAAVVYVGGIGIEWDAHREAHAAAARRRRGQAEQDRLDVLDGISRGAAQEREYLELSWAVDYADLTAGRAAASAMAGVGLPVNYELNRAVMAELRRQEPAGLAERCRGLRVPVLLVQGACDPRPVAACDSLAAALPEVSRVVLPAAGHLPWAEAPGRVGSLLRDFLAGLPSW